MYGKDRQIEAVKTIKQDNVVKKEANRTGEIFLKREIIEKTKRDIK